MRTEHECHHGRVGNKHYAFYSDIKMSVIYFNFVRQHKCPNIILEWKKIIMNL